MTLTKISGNYGNFNGDFLTLLFLCIYWLAFYSKQEFSLIYLKLCIFNINIKYLMSIIYFDVQTVLDLASGSLCMLVFLSFDMSHHFLFEHFLTFWPN